MHLPFKIDLSIRIMVIVCGINHLLIGLIELTDLCLQLLILYLLESYSLCSYCLIFIAFGFDESKLLLRMFVSLLYLSHFFNELLVYSLLLVEFF